MRHYPIDDENVVTISMAAVFVIWALLVVHPVAVLPLIAILGGIWRG